MSTETGLRDEFLESNDEVSVFDLLQVLAENLRLLVIGTLMCGMIGAGTSFLIRPTFTAIATFLPPQQQQGMASSLLQSLGAISGLAGGGGGLKNPNDQYVSFLKSNAVEDALIQRFNLTEYYNTRYKIDARTKLEKNTRILSGKDNIIGIEFDDADPQMAANVANAYSEELTKLLGRLAITEAQQRREFFGKQLQVTKDNLVAAEKSLAATGVSISALNSNPSTALAGPANLRAQVTAQEVKLASMRSYLTENAPEFIRGSAELSALRRQLQKAESTQPTVSGSDNDYIAKYRDFKYQETLFDLFSRQFELARVDESREGSLVQVIDNAQVPEKKSKPNRMLITALSVLGSAAFLIMFIFIRQGWRSLKNNEASATSLKKLRSALYRSVGRRSY